MRTARGISSSRSGLRNRRQASSVGSENEIFDCVMTVNSGMEDWRKVLEESVAIKLSEGLTLPPKLLKPVA